MTDQKLETPEAMAERYHWSDPSIEQMASEISARDKAVALESLETYRLKVAELESALAAEREKCARLELHRAIRQKLSPGDSQTPGTRGSGPAGPTTGSDESLISDGMPSSSRPSGDDAASGSESRLTPAPLTFNENLSSEPGHPEPPIREIILDERGEEFDPLRQLPLTDKSVREAREGIARELARQVHELEKIEQASRLTDRPEPHSHPEYVTRAELKHVLKRVTELERRIGTGTVAAPPRY